MARVAKKKTVNNNLGYEFSIKKSDIVRRADFGSFEVIQTQYGILFKNYTGYHVYTTPYAVGYDGVAHKNSLYEWLENLLNAKEVFEGHLDEQFENLTTESGTPVTNQDMLDMQRITAEANLIMPLVVFTDPNEAMIQAKKRLDWFKEQQNKLAEELNKETPDASEQEAVKADAEEGVKVMMSDTVQEMLEESKEDIADAE